MLQDPAVRNRERPRALGDQLRIEHVERNAAKMVGMEMREQDEVDRVAVDAKPLHRDERRGAAINQKTGSAALGATAPCLREGRSPQYQPLIAVRVSPW